MVCFISAKFCGFLIKALETIMLLSSKLSINSSSLGGGINSRGYLSLGI